MWIKLNDCSKGGNLYHTLESLQSLSSSPCSNLAVLLIPLWHPHQKCYKREKDDVIITGKSSVYSDKMTSASGRCQINQWPQGTQISLPYKIGRLGIIRGKGERWEGRLLITSTPTCRFYHNRPIEKIRFSIVYDKEWEVTKNLILTTLKWAAYAKRNLMVRTGKEMLLKFYCFE